MTITSLSGIGGPQATQSVSNATSKLQAAISSILGGQSDNADVSEASQLQAQTSGLKQALTNLAQASSLTQVAGNGINQIFAALAQLQSLAQQANAPTLNPANQEDINQQFNQTINTVDQLATGTTFNGQSLLNGNLSGNGALSLDSLLGAGSSGNGSLAIGNLSSNSLLAGIGDLSSSANANQALGVISNALNQVNSANAAVGSFQQTLDFAAANVASASSNFEAANASLSESDFTAASTQDTQALVQSDAAIAVAAQSNNLSPALLQLVA